MRVAGWLTITGGGLLVAGSFVTYFLYQDARSNPPPIDQSRDAYNRKLSDYRLANNLLLVTGVLGVTTGIALVLFAPKDRPASTVSFRLSPGAAAVVGTF